MCYALKFMYLHYRRISSLLFPLLISSRHEFIGHSDNGTMYVCGRHYSYHCSSAILSSRSLFSFARYIYQCILSERGRLYDVEDQNKVQYHLNNKPSHRKSSKLCSGRCKTYCSSCSILNKTHRKEIDV